MVKKFKAGDVCTILYRNLVSMCEVGDIVIIEQDYVGKEVEVRLNSREVVFMLPGFLQKIGRL